MNKRFVKKGKISNDSTKYSGSGVFAKLNAQQKGVQGTVDGQKEGGDGGGKHFKL